jgi:hypothetical protein
LKRPSSSVKQLNRALLDRTAFVGRCSYRRYLCYRKEVMNSVENSPDSFLENATNITCVYHPDRMADGFVISKSGKPIGVCEECGPIA